MNRRLVLPLFLLSLMISGVIVITFQPIKADSKTITVPDDYATIQEAVNHANNGDTINVKSGTYQENLLLNKSISLLGEDKETTFLVSNGAGNVIQVVADNTTISGFTISNAEANPSGFGYFGINLTSNNNSITNNIVTENSDHGINLMNSNYNTITGNLVYLNHWCGIVLVDSDYNNISGNNVTQNYHNNNGVGILLQDDSAFNIIENNIVAKNNGGVGFSPLMSANGCNDNILRNNSISENLFDGVFLYHCGQRNRIEQNDIVQNGGGVHLYDSDRNIIVGNNISRNTYGGIGFEHSRYNFFYHNNIVENTPQTFYFSSNNSWDNGYPSGGNYWSDYTGVDADGDGIGDTPRIIEGDIQDNYPLMAPYHMPVATWNWIDFGDSFKDSHGEPLQEGPLSFRLTYANGTVSTPLSVGTYLLQTGTTIMDSIEWQGTDVTPDLFIVFDSVYGAPVVNCKVYQLTVEPIFYNMSLNQTTKLKPSSWFMSFPNGTIGTFYSNVTLPQTQTGYYEIRNAVVQNENITFPPATLWLTSNTEWSPSIGIFDAGENQTFGFNSNSTITQPDFNTTSQVLSFTASGPDGTGGYTQVTFAKDLVPNPEVFSVLEDGQPISHSLVLMDDTWLLSIDYMHSTHNFEVCFADLVPELPQFTVLTTFIIALILFAALASVFTRRQKRADGPKKAY